MRIGLGLLNLSRPLTQVAILGFYLVGWETTMPLRATLAVALVFYLVSSAVIVGWVSTPPGWKRTFLWLEILVTALLNAAMDGGLGSFLFGVIAVSIFLVLAREAWWIAIGASLTAWLISGFVVGVGGAPLNWESSIAYLGFYLFTGTVGFLIRSLMDEQQRSQQLLAEVTEARTQLERTLQQLRESAAREQELQVVAERQRLAREIHDSVGHGLTGLLVQLQAARRTLDREPRRTAAMLGQCEEAAREALQETRRAVQALHPAGLEQHREVDALRRLARDFGAATGMQVEFRADAEAEALPPDPRRLEQLYRIFQESLTNAHRHGQAQQVWAEFTAAGTTLELQVVNDGRPPEHLEPGVGIRAMQERAQSLGGTVHFEPGAAGGRGLAVVVRLPKEPAKEKEAPR